MSPEVSISLRFILDVEDEWPPVGTESLPFRKTGSGYEALLPPLFVSGLSVGDVIEISRDEAGFVSHWHHLRKSKRSVVWILRTGLNGRIDATLDEIRTMGCNTVGHKKLGCYAIDVPEDINMDLIEGSLSCLDSSAYAVAFPSLRHHQ